MGEAASGPVARGDAFLCAAAPSPVTSPLRYSIFVFDSAANVKTVRCDDRRGRLVAVSLGRRLGSGSAAPARPGPSGRPKLASCAFSILSAGGRGGVARSYLLGPRPRTLFSLARPADHPRIPRPTRRSDKANFSFESRRTTVGGTGRAFRRHLAFGSSTDAYNS